MQHWLESYQDLLGKLTSDKNDISATPPPTTTTTPTPTTTASSLLMSFIGDFIPYLTGSKDKDEKSSNDSQQEVISDNLESDDDDDDKNLSSNFIRRQGLAFDVNDLESKR